MPLYPATRTRDLGYAESRTHFTFTNNLTWNDVTGLSITITVPASGIVRLRFRGSWTVSATDKAVVVCRFYDTGAAAEVGRGKFQFMHLGTAAGAAEAYGGVAEAECKLTGLTPGTSKTYKVQALKIADVTTITVQLDGDSAPDKNAHHIEAWTDV